MMGNGRIWFICLLLLASAGRGEEKLVDLTSCTGISGNGLGLAGNVSEPVAVFDHTRQFITWFSDTDQIVMAAYDGTMDCPTKTIELADGSESQSKSHDAPSVFVDGDGYVYSAYLGRMILDLDLPQLGMAPMLQRSLLPLNVDSWVMLDGLPGVDRARLNNHSELTGLRLFDGTVLLAGVDTEVIIDRVGAGGLYQWTNGRKIISVDDLNNPDIMNDRSFSKAVFHEGQVSPRRLYTVWGWACGRAVSPEEGCYHYVDSSDKVYFAYSDDTGLTWKNREGNRLIEAVGAPHPGYGDDRTAIRITDDAFVISETKQAEHRAIWETSDRNILIAFAGARCDDPIDCPEPLGALRMLRIRLGEDGCDATLEDCVEEYVVSEAEHSFIPVIRRHNGTIYIYAVNVTLGVLFEYSSTDAGLTWERKPIIEDCGGCARVHGLERVPGMDSVHLVASCPSPSNFCFNTDRQMYYYYKIFDEPDPDITGTDPSGIPYGTLQ